MGFMIKDVNQEAQIVEAEGEPLNFDRFFQDHYPRLVRALFLMTGSGSESEDLAQEAFVRCLERWDRVARMESPIGYVFRTALNLQRKRIRSLGRKRGVEVAPANDPIDGAEVRIDLVRLIHQLPAPQREALVLTSWLGLSTEEAAAALRIAPSSVRGRVHRARLSLKETQPNG